MNPSIETATLGGGCFWCLDAVYRRVEGVLGVESGYAGGHVARPGYEQVCSGNTGHAEVVRVRFDPARIGYREILDIFFAMHDPTQLNRQGNDVGTQYRSVIFAHSDAQRDTALRIIDELTAQRVYDGAIVTQVTPPGGTFHGTCDDTIHGALDGTLHGTRDGTIHDTPNDNYWPAEDYHQNYFASHSGQGYCAFIVAPKVAKFRQQFAHRLRVS